MNLLSNGYVSPALGLTLLISLFLLCLILVCGIKAILLSVHKQFFNKHEPTTSQKKPRAKRKPVRTIHIDPDEVDRVYFKKIS